MLERRILTALVLIPLLVGVTLWGNSLLFAILAGSFVLLAAYEWAALAGFRQLPARLAYCLVLLLALAFLFPVLDGSWVGPLLLVTSGGWCVALVLVTLYQSGRWSGTGTVTIRPVLGFLLLLPPWAGLVLLHGRDNGPELILLLLVLVWSADSGAYFSGRCWGRRKLADRISPGKTWEGVGGGLLVSQLAAVLYMQLVGTFGIDIVWLALLCIFTVIISVVGDLIESLFKRLANIKDSGSILPGHGGVLDRIDSLTAAVPLFVGGLGLIGVRL